MKIAIDYDDTYTRDPEMWNLFISSAFFRGHEVWCVSARKESHMEEVRRAVWPYLEESKCVGTGGVAKDAYMWKSYEVLIDVWIDDNPSSIIYHYDD